MCYGSVSHLTVSESERLIWMRFKNALYLSAIYDRGAAYMQLASECHVSRARVQIQSTEDGEEKEGQWI